MNATLTRTWSAILFDLDGTITDSAPAITSSLARTFALLGRPVPAATELLAYVGPPMLDAFQEYAGMTRDEAVEAIAVYRAEYHGAAALDTAVYPGVAGLLERIHAAGIPLALADHTRSKKSDIVSEALARLAATGVDTSNTVLVGDRSYDAIGAQAHGIPAILVEWGYGSPAEAAAATAVVHSTDQLGKLLLG